MRSLTAIALSFWLAAQFVAPAAPWAEDAVDLAKLARIKAACLYHLAKLSRWPAAARLSTGDSLCIRVVGDDPYDLAGYFRRQVQRRSADPHPFDVETVSADELRLGGADAIRRLATGCHILFLTESVGDSLDDLLPALATSPVLLAGESRGFARAGGMVGFTVDERGIAIEVNLDAVDRADLGISAEFLQHARLVTTDRGGDSGRKER